MLEADYKSINQQTFIQNPNYHGLANMPVDVPSMVRPYVNTMLAYILDELQRRATENYGRAYAYNLTSRDRYNNIYLKAIVNSAAEEFVYMVSYQRKDPNEIIKTVCVNAVNTFVAVNVFRPGNEELRNALSPTILSSIQAWINQATALQAQIQQLKNQAGGAGAQVNQVQGGQTDRFGNRLATNGQGQYLQHSSGAYIVISPTNTYCVTDQHGNLLALNNNYQIVGPYQQQQPMYNAPVSTGSPHAAALAGSSTNTVMVGNQQTGTTPLYGDRAIDLRAKRGEAPVEVQTTQVQSSAQTSGSSSLVESITLGGGSGPVVVQNNQPQNIAYNLGAQSMNAFAQSPEVNNNDGLVFEFIAQSERKRTRTALLPYSIAYDPTTHVGRYLINEDGAAHEVVESISSVFGENVDMTQMDYYRHELNALARREQKNYEQSLQPEARQTTERAWAMLGVSTLSEQEVTEKMAAFENDADRKDGTLEIKNGIMLDDMAASSLEEAMTMAELTMSSLKLGVLDATFMFNRLRKVGFVIEETPIENHGKMADRILESTTLEDLCFALRSTVRKVYPRLWHYVNDKATEVINHALNVNLSLGISIDSFHDDFVELVPYLENKYGKVISRAFVGHDHEMIKQIIGSVQRDEVVNGNSYVLTTSDFVTRVPFLSENFGFVMHEATAAVVSTITPMLHGAMKAIVNNRTRAGRMFIVTLDNYVLEVAEGWLTEGVILVHRLDKTE